jgi:hypothetical protein
MHKTKRGSSLGSPFVTPLKARCPYYLTGYPREIIVRPLPSLMQVLGQNLRIPQPRQVIDSTGVIAAKGNACQPHIPFFTENLR